MKKKRLIIILTLIVMAIISVLVYLKERKVIVKSIMTPNSSDELYKIIQNNINDNRRQNILSKNEIVLDASKDTNDYSETNVQVTGVDEADFVKTDGEYIYILSGDYLNIVKINKDEMEVVSKIKANENTKEISSSYTEMYVKDNKLVIIKQIYNNYIDSMFPYYMDSQETSAVVFNLSDKLKPKKEGELSQSGSYISSRLIDNYLYLTTNHHVYKDIKKNDTKTFLPNIITNERKAINIDDVFVMPNPTNTYMTITGIDINNLNKHISSKAVLGNSNNMYANTESIYISGVDYNNELKTSIIKFKMNKGQLSLSGTTSVKGNILNQFSMDEYNDYFRIVTTSYNNNLFGIDDIVRPQEEETTKNNLYILDNNLKVVGKLENLAKGERVYSVRFDGDMGYFVTFRQVDPLFVVDLSNPKNPVINTELKIPGFSEYLHVYNDKYLFGLGKEANKDGRVTALKISMFDISDKNNVIEKYKTIIGNDSSWSEASYNHKAILVSKDKSIIGFPLNDSYVIYKFTDEVGFTKLKELQFKSHYYDRSRGLYVGDYLYAIISSQIKTLNLNTLEEGKSVELSTYTKDKDYIEPKID